MLLQENEYLIQNNNNLVREIQYLRGNRDNNIGSARQGQITVEIEDKLIKNMTKKIELVTMLDD